MVNKQIIWQSSKGEKTIYISEKSYNWVYPHKCSEFVDDAEKYSYKLATLEDYNKLIEDEKISKDRYYFIEGGLVNILGKCSEPKKVEYHVLIVEELKRLQK